MPISTTGFCQTFIRVSFRATFMILLRCVKKFGENNVTNNCKTNSGHNVLIQPILRNKTSNLSADLSFHSERAGCTARAMNLPCYDETNSTTMGLLVPSRQSRQSCRARAGSKLLGRVLTENSMSSNLCAVGADRLLQTKRVS
jgi:hypothetical protein